MDSPPRGGLREEFGGAPRVLILTLGLIEEFEDVHTRGMHAVFEDLITPGRSPRAREVIDLLILGLVGGGMDRAQARALVEDGLPAGLQRHLSVAHALIGVALHPDVWDEVDEDDTDAEDGDAEGKPTAVGSTSAG